MYDTKRQDDPYRFCLQDSEKYADTTSFVVIAVTTRFVVTPVKPSLDITAVTTSFIVTVIRPNVTTKLVVTF